MEEVLGRVAKLQTSMPAACTFSCVDLGIRRSIALLGAAFKSRDLLASSRAGCSVGATMARGSLFCWSSSSHALELQSVEPSGRGCCDSKRRSW